jgi:hypothetical protein
MKQETLEEVAENYFNNFTKRKEKFAFIDGAKWQQEQNKNKYSEEDMKSSFQVGFNVGYNDEESPSYLTFEEWFEELKKIKMKQTGKLTTDGKEIFEGDYIKAKTKGKYPLVLVGQVKWSEENQKWLNLNFFDDDVEHTIFKISEKEFEQFKKK